jgi:hypothetical protein
LLRSSVERRVRLSARFLIPLQFICSKARVKRPYANTTNKVVLSTKSVAYSATLQIEHHQ